MGNLSKHDEPRLDRKVAIRGDLITLLGMTLVIGSLFLTWERLNFGDGKSLVPGAFFSTPMLIVHTGFGISERYWLISCALLSGLLLLWTPNQKTRASLAMVQGACGLACLTIALRKFALLPGTLMGFVGSVALLLGGLDRYQVNSPNRKGN